MEFKHGRQHSPAMLDEFKRLLAQDAWPMRQALVLADELVSHAHPAAERVINQLKQARHPNAVALAHRLDQCQHRLRQYFQLEKIGPDLLNLTYRQNGYVFFRNQQPSRKLLVIFSTMFNNFYLSNLAMFQLVRGLGCHVLLLKDASLTNYHRGVDGFATDMPGIADRLRVIASETGVDHISLTGFSSGGYAAMLTSLLLPGSNYLGFSHPTDLSAGSPRPPGQFFTPDVMAQLDPRWLLDLRPRLEQADPTGRRILVYGDQSVQDSLHADHLNGVAGIELICLQGTGHNTIQSLMADGRLVDLFSRLVADR